MEAQAVIGAGYGDEGKGLMVDALVARTPGAVVVRINGGAQAGHTVVLPDGRRHVFHHFGSGALAGAPTHLSRHFANHPMLFGAERVALERLDANVGATSDPRGPVTTPWDVAVNQAAEVARGGGRHGSCGVGFGETVGRDLLPEFRLRMGDLSRPGLRRRLKAIRDEWMPSRLAGLGMGLGVLGADTEAAIVADVALDRFLDDCRAYLDAVGTRDDASLGSGPVVFEGAQGLMLDQDRGAFPFVTRSSTGLRNMADVAREAGIEGIEAHYVTRAYVTRHGAGPLAGEGDVPFAVVDPTNAPNPWQGAIRYARLDLDVLGKAIRDDLGDAGDMWVRPILVVTCLDQATGRIPYLAGGSEFRAAPGSAHESLAEFLGIPAGFGSWGPTRDTLRAPCRHSRKAA